MANNYAALFKHYISLTKEFIFENTLENSTSYTLEIINKLLEEKANYSYQDGKWTVKQVLSHIIDTERIMSYRALRYARQDKTKLSGFDDEFYAANAGSENRTLESLIGEFIGLRKSTSQLFGSFTAKMLAYYGPEEQKGLTVEKIGRIIAGHSMHHCNILVKRYQV